VHPWTVDCARMPTAVLFAMLLEFADAALTGAPSGVRSVSPVGHAVRVYAVALRAPELEEDEDECIIDPNLAVERVRGVATRNIIDGASKGARRSIVAAAEVRAAAEAAEASSEARAELSDVKVKELADCLSDADDARGVDECMAAYCASDDECIMNYADNICDEGSGEEPTPRRGLLGRVLGFFGR